MRILLSLAVCCLCMPICASASEVTFETKIYPHEENGKLTWAGGMTVTIVDSIHCCRDSASVPKTPCLLTRIAQVNYLVTDLNGFQDEFNARHHGLWPALSAVAVSCRETGDTPVRDADIRVVSALDKMMSEKCLDIFESVLTPTKTPWPIANSATELPERFLVRSFALYRVTMTYQFETLKP